MPLPTGDDEWSLYVEIRSGKTNIVNVAKIKPEPASVFARSEIVPFQFWVGSELIR